MTAPIAVEEQLARVLASTRLLEVETLPVPEARGRTLRQPVRAAVDIPVFDNSAMDGFAVRFADVTDATGAAPVALTVVADLPAGTADDPALRAGEAARIMTGSPVPADADAIVPFEDTAGGLADSLGTVTVQRAPAKAGAHIRRAGEDLRAGDEVLPAGVVFGAWQQGAAGAAGVAEVVVSRCPRVAVISTGTELVAPGSPLRRGQIPESNSVLLAGLVAEAGADLVLRTSVDDEGSQLRDVLAGVLDEVDAVIFSGGVSAGAYEVVKNELAGTMTFSKVAMQPGKPQGFGVAPSGALLFGLPGNPVSAAVSFEVFVRPALLAMQGRAALARPVLRLPASTAWKTPPNRRQYLPATIDRSDPSRWTAGPATAGGSGSHRAGGLGAAEAYVVVPAEVDAVAAGDEVDVWTLEG
ncbi:molybdopterin molybdotransferase MoeA [Microbacterium invictum]|uniref:Molybdopterin molybdenumtransferase n=1 Tax=Microbacterium invictum TaxID=515415 RepID=A0AA40SLD6_9MICO|nr:gephyrin-like molybdotransferase Glp [Microbacterium invictum]MBB4138370.1 molybdopterin molybdotransferase [Microbacterium invictum]